MLKEFSFKCLSCGRLLGGIFSDLGPCSCPNHLEIKKKNTLFEISCEDIRLVGAIIEIKGVRTRSKLLDF